MTDGLGSLGIGFMALAALAACGGPTDSDASADDDLERRGATLVVKPVLEDSGIEGGVDLTGLDVRRVSLNLGEVRLLGTDPRFPAEGVPVLNEDRILQGTVDDPPALEIALPEALLDDPDLAVFIRLGPSPQLDGASVEIRARADDERLSALAAIDDPATASDTVMAEAGGCASDPSVEDCARVTASHIARAAASGAEVSVQLRDHAVVDLVTTLSEAGDLEVALGIPLERWLKPGPQRRVEASWTTPDHGAESLRLRLLPQAQPRQARTSFGYRLD